MKKYLLSAILVTALAGGFFFKDNAALAKSPSKHDDLVINVTLPAQPEPTPAPVAEPTPVIINNTATATNNNYPTNTNNIDLDLINSIKDLVKDMSAEKCKEAKSKAYPYKTSWGDYQNVNYNNSWLSQDWDKYNWNADLAGYSNSNYSNIDWESEWNNAWDEGWSNGWDTGWDDAFNYIQSNEWSNSANDGSGSSTTTEQSTYSI